MHCHRLCVFVTEELSEVLNVWMTERVALLQWLHKIITSSGTKIVAHFQGLNHRIAKYEQVINFSEQEMVSLRGDKFYQEGVFGQKDQSLRGTCFRCKPSLRNFAKVKRRSSCKCV